MIIFRKHLDIRRKTNTKTQKTRSGTKKKTGKNSNVKPISKKSFWCKICGRKFLSYSGKYRHEKNCISLQKPFRCAKCGKWFASKDSVKTHLNNVHIKKDRRACPKCDRVFLYRSTLWRHLRRDH